MLERLADHAGYIISIVIRWRGLGDWSASRLFNPEMDREMIGK
jgi:hypothetical protein